MIPDSIYIYLSAEYIITVTAPHAKANTSVTLVTVTETPACRSAWAILWSEVRPALASSGLLFTLDSDCKMVTGSRLY